MTATEVTMPPITFNKTRHWVMANTYLQQCNSHQYYNTLFLPKPDNNMADKIRATHEEKKRHWEDRLKLKAISAPDLSKKLTHLSVIATDSHCSSCHNIQSRSRKDSGQSDWSSKVKIKSQSDDVVVVEIDLSETSKDDAFRIHVDKEHVVLYEVSEGKYGKEHENILIKYPLPPEVNVSRWHSESTKDRKLSLHLYTT